MYCVMFYKVDMKSVSVQSAPIKTIP